MTAPGAPPTSPTSSTPPAPAGGPGAWRARAKIAGALIAAVAAAGALLQGLGAFSSGSEAGSTTVTADRGGNAVTGGQSNSCVASGAGATVTCLSPTPVAAELDDKAAEQSILGTATPAAPGPWPFTVLYDQQDGKDVGVWVRSAPTRAGFHIGLAGHAQTVWVDCVRTTDFNADPGLPTGPRWYKVHWPRAERSDALASSSPSDPAQGWVYVYYVRPNGTNGKVPTC